MKRFYTLWLCRYSHDLTVDGKAAQARLEIRVPTRRVPGQESLALADIRDADMRTSASIGLFLKGTAPSQDRIRLAGSQIGVATLEWVPGSLNHFAVLRLPTWSLSDGDELRAFAHGILEAAVRNSFRPDQTVEWGEELRFVFKPEIFSRRI